MAAELSFCSDCVDVSLQWPPLKNDPPQLGSASVTTSWHAPPTAPVVSSERDRRPQLDERYRLTLTFLSSVVLLT
jgi:hypothetical protein